MTAPRIGSLFTGYGGLDLAVAEVFGGTVAWHSEIDPGACKILDHRFPGVPNIGDVTTVDWSTVEPVDILIGGFPCQDVSGAGKRAGLHHGTRSGLWHAYARAIAELRPSVVVIENVRGLLTARGDEPTDQHLAAEHTVVACKHLTTWIDKRLAHAQREGRTDDARALAARRGRVMGCRKRAVARARRHERRLVRAIGTVLGSLADLGYDTSWHSLRASDVGAPHNRFRVFIVATDTRSEHGIKRWLTAPGETPRRRALGEPAGRGGVGTLLPSPRATDGTKGSPNQHGSSGDLMLPSAVQRLLPTPTTQDGANTNGPSQMERNSLPLNAAVTLLPTPRSATARTGRSAAIRRDSMSGPSLEQAIEVADGVLPREFESWEELPPSWQPEKLLPTPAVNDMGAGKSVEEWDEWTADMKDRHGNGNGHGPSLAIEAQRLLPTPRSTRGGSTTETAYGFGGERSDEHRPQGQVLIANEVSWGLYEGAIRRWEDATRVVPSPTEPGPKGAPRLAPAFSEWMMGLPAGWVTGVPGVTRNEALRAIGNGVVPQQAAAGVAIAAWELVA